MRWLAAVLMLAALTVTVGCDDKEESSPRDLGLSEAEASALLEQDLAAARQTSFSVDYMLAGLEGNSVSITWHREPNGRNRFDVGIGGESTSVFYTDGSDTQVICAEDARFVLDPVPGSITGGVCSSNPTADVAWMIILVPLLGYGSEDLDQEVPVTRVTERRIAGERARCYTSASPDGGTSCLAGGILLAAFAEEDEDSLTITAVEVRTPADPAAFELPYPLVDPEE